MLGEGQKLVQKPLFGAQGKGLRLIAALSDLAPPDEVSGVYYLQEFVPPAQAHHQDWRIFVCQGVVVASMIRHGASWITNIKQGARAKAAIASQELIDLAVRSTSCIGADYAGVDIIQAQDGGFLVLEVNSMPAWNGLQAVSRQNIADHLVGAFLDAALADDPPERPRGRLSRTSKLNPVAQAFHDSCLAELDALKPGNVHRLGEDKRMSVADFESSAAAAAPAIGRSGLGVGQRIGRAIEATRAAVGHNTNLGIVLLASPFASALDRKHGDLRTRLGEVLRCPDASRMRARPIGRSAWRSLAVSAPRPSMTWPRSRDVTLLEAMRAAELATASPGIIPTVMSIFSNSGSFG